MARLISSIPTDCSVVAEDISVTNSAICCACLAMVPKVSLVEFTKVSPSLMQAKLLPDYAYGSAIFRNRYGIGGVFTATARKRGIMALRS
ncbi:hypothetical protein VRRI112168_15535 [Vreelandella rituensis]